VADHAVTTSPAELARRLYTALGEGDRAALEALLAPDFAGVLAEGMPFGIGGTHDGAAAMRRDGWGAIARHFAVRAEPDRFLALTDGRLLVTGRYTGTGRNGGGPVDAAFAHLLTVAGGRISALEQYTDTARWVAAAGPRAAPSPAAAGPGAPAPSAATSPAAAAPSAATSPAAAGPGAPAPGAATAPAGRAGLSALTLHVADGLAEVRLDRPDQGNAINAAVARDLGEVATRLAGDSSVRAVLLTGAGPMFTVGGDLAMLTDTPRGELPDTLRRMIDDYHRALERLTELDAPLVVAVRGAAAGGGLGLVCAADVVVAATDSVFAVGYARLGLTSDGGNTWFLPRLVGLRRAQELFLLNRRLTAAEALEWGLVTRVVPADEVESAARDLAAGLAAGPTQALGGMRRLLRRSYDTGLREQLAAEQGSIVTAAATADAHEGITAFTGHRRPRFTGH
jgi:2-(1,2-epoxy-1,2-dihydrophenyl)acetyl-CoA isomerase